MKFTEEETTWAFFMAAQVADTKSYIANLENLENIYVDNNTNQERKVILNDLYEKLSFEAKEVIRIILTAPAEIVQIMTPKTKKITRRRILEFIAFHFSNRKGKRIRSLSEVDKKTKRIFKELEEFVGNF